MKSMKSVMTWSIVILLSALISVVAIKAEDEEMAARHERWMEKHGRIYGGESEKQMRLGVFTENVEFIRSFNAKKNASFSLSPNAFADLTSSEFNRLTPLHRHVDIIAGSDDGEQVSSSSSFCQISNNNNNNYRRSDNNNNNSSSIPANVDWRERGAVNPIRDQGECSVCWAFATAAAVEGFAYLQTGNLPEVSVEQLVECVYATVGRDGCFTGAAEDAYAFIIQNGGVATQSSFPNSGNGCVAASLRHVIRGFGQVEPPNDEEALKAAVARQPMSAVLSAGSREFQFYSGGVFTASCGDEGPNHMGTLVGYGTTEEGVDFWVLRNQWGQNWGEGGYVRLLRNSGEQGGQCQIASSVTFPY